MEFRAAKRSFDRSGLVSFIFRESGFFRESGAGSGLPPLANAVATAAFHHIPPPFTAVPLLRPLPLIAFPPPCTAVCCCNQINGRIVGKLNAIEPIDVFEGPAQRPLSLPFPALPRCSVCNKTLNTTTLNPRTQNPTPQPSALNPQPETPQPSTLNPYICLLSLTNAVCVWSTVCREARRLGVVKLVNRTCLDFTVSLAAVPSASKDWG